LSWTSRVMYVLYGSDYSRRLVRYVDSRTPRLPGAEGVCVCKCVCCYWLCVHSPCVPVRPQCHGQASAITYHSNTGNLKCSCIICWCQYIAVLILLTPAIWNTVTITSEFVVRLLQSALRCIA